jgi:hypothetical protein
MTKFREIVFKFREILTKSFCENKIVLLISYFTKWQKAYFVNTL